MPLACNANALGWSANALAVVETTPEIPQRSVYPSGEPSGKLFAAGSFLDDDSGRRQIYIFYYLFIIYIYIYLFIYLFIYAYIYISQLLFHPIAPLEEGGVASQRGWIFA